MQCRAPTSATTCAGGSPTGAQLVYDAERRLTHWQNAQTNPTSQAWFMYDGSGQRVEQYVSGGSGNHTYYLPCAVEEVTPRRIKHPITGTVDASRSSPVIHQTDLLWLILLLVAIAVFCLLLTYALGTAMPPPPDSPA